MAAPTAIIYDGKRLIPAPKLTFSRQHRRSGDQSAIGTEHQVTLSGDLAGCKGWDFSGGSPEFYTGNDYPADQSYTTCDAFSNLVEMQEKLRDMFSMDGEYRWFEVVGCNGLIRKWRARVINIEFPEGQWTHVANYSITLGLQTDAITDDDLHIDHTETWEVQFDEENGGIYSLSHTLSCQSEEFVDDSDHNHGWEVAKTWLDDRRAGSDYTGSAPTTIKNDYIFNSTGFNLTGYTSYDYTVQRSLDEYGGTYSITETWTLAKDPVFRTWTLTYSDPRDDYATVSIEGEFRSFLDRTESTETTPTNGDAALTAYNTWEGASGPYTEASAYYTARGGCDTLGACPVNKSVTITEESRGDATATYGEATRKVQFSFEFSDSDPGAEVSLTRSMETTNMETCENRVTINGQIQGHTCSCSTSKLDNATTAYGLINCATEANTVYAAQGGTGTLTQVRSSYAENERDGTIEFTCEFTDRFDGGFITDERATTSWACGDLVTGGTSKTTYTVEGTIKSTCDGAMPTAPSTGAYNCDGDACCTLKRTSVTKDTTNKIVNYTYEWDNDCGPGLVEIVVDTTKDPSDCANFQVNVDIACQGTGCDSNTMLTNALTAVNAVDPTVYAPVGACQTAYRENKNVTRGNVRRTYSYSTECDATLNVTTTETFEATRCDDDAHSVEGEIKGHCYASGGAMAAAEALFASHGPAVYADGSFTMSTRVSRNAKSGTIRFNYEFRSATDGYEHEQTVTTKTDNSDCCTEVTLSGTITPYCTASGEAGMVAAGEAAWATVQSTLETDAQTYCTPDVVLRSTSVTRNKRNGQVTYSYTYMCCDVIVTGALKESINITKEFPADVVAIVPILGRTCGPVIQDKGTKTVEKCTVSIDLQFEKKCGSSLAKPSGLEAEIQGIITSANCCDGAYATHTERDTESWNPRTGRYTRNVTTICECCT